jgi:hypothetical protein
MLSPHPDFASLRPRDLSLLKPMSSRTPPHQSSNLSLPCPSHCHLTLSTRRVHPCHPIPGRAHAMAIQSQNRSIHLPDSLRRRSARWIMPRTSGTCCIRQQRLRLSRRVHNYHSHARSRSTRRHLHTSLIKRFSCRPSVHSCRSDLRTSLCPILGGLDLELWRPLRTLVFGLHLFFFLSERALY